MISVSGFLYELTKYRTVLFYIYILILVFWRTDDTKIKSVLISTRISWCQCWCISPHCFTTHKTNIDMFTAVRTSNLKQFLQFTLLLVLLWALLILPLLWFRLYADVQKDIIGSCTEWCRNKEMWEVYYSVGFCTTCLVRYLHITWSLSAPTNVGQNCLSSSEQCHILTWATHATPRQPNRCISELCQQPHRWLSAHKLFHRDPV
jgi:hypothetical protein